MAYAITIVVLLLGNIPLWGCTATSTVDTAHRLKGSEAYEDALRIASEVVRDSQDLEPLQGVLEAGTGTLLCEWVWGGVRPISSRAVARHWGCRTVRLHMRLHMLQWMSEPRWLKNWYRRRYGNDTGHWGG